jgi:hypothetical protein
LANRQFDEHNVPPASPGELVINSLGTFVQEQMTMLGWDRETLAERSGLDRWTVEGILDLPHLASWPEPDEMQALADALAMPVREVVLRAAQASGLDVYGPLNPTETLQLASNEDLTAEVRRRLALGAVTGGYLAGPGRRADAHRTPSA